jgi:hypothetical protein
VTVPPLAEAADGGRSTRSLARRRADELDARRPLEVGVLRLERSTVRPCSRQGDGVRHRDAEFDARAISRELRIPQIG